MGKTFFTSADGDQWIAQSPPSRDRLIGVAYANGQFVAVDSTGHSYRSPTGVGWSSQTVEVPELIAMTDLTAGGGLFVATGYAQGHRGIIISSTDGQNWTNQVAPLGLEGSPPALTSIAYGGGYFVALADGGPILTSPDGVHWTARNRGVPYSLGSVCFANGSFLAAGVAGIVLRSGNLLAATLTPRRTSAGFEVALDGLTGQTYRIQATADLTSGTWTDIAFVSVHQTNGVVFTDQGTSKLPRRFYRAVSP